jgi:hypothetical protein
MRSFANAVTDESLVDVVVFLHQALSPPVLGGSAFHSVARSRTDRDRRSYT